MKAKFSTDSMGRVTLAYDEFDLLREETVRVERVFTCPLEGGYVREQDSRGNWEQVCEQLAGMGNTLACSSRDRLLDLIRAEYRAMRRAEKRATQL